MSSCRLYDYPRSSAAYRVRIALLLKGIAFEKIPIPLLEAAQHAPAYLELNPQGLVPSLVIDGHTLTQSLAILEYLEACYPNPALLPADPADKAKVRALALSIAADLHPLNNLRVLQQLEQQFQADKDQKQQWYHHWLKTAFDAFETSLQGLKRTQPVCFGDQFSFADLCLIPQLYNARRFDFDLESYPLIREIEAYCHQNPAFKAAAP